MFQRFSLAAAFLVVAGSLFAADKPAKPPLIYKVYSVADLVIPIPGTPAACCQDAESCPLCDAHGYPLPPTA